MRNYKKEQLNINKIPMQTVPINKTNDFETENKYPLYLEVIENKEKIKQDLVNTEFVVSPTNAASDIEIASDSDNHISDIDELLDESPSGNVYKEKNDDVDNNNIDDETYTVKKYEEENVSDNENITENFASDKKDSLEENNLSNDDLDNNDKESHDKEDRTGESYDKENQDEESYDKEDQDEVSKNNIEIEDLEKSIEDELNDISDLDDISDSEIDKDCEDLEKELKQLMKEKNKISSRKHSIPVKYTKERDKRGRQTFDKKVPKLKDINVKDNTYIPSAEKYNTPNIPEVNSEDEIRELLFKFDVLKKSYPHINIPDISVHTDHITLRGMYDDAVRRVSLDSSVDNYKKYLVMGFMGVEFLFGKFFKFDMSGFAQNQIASMNSYERLLIELGSESYKPGGKKLPVWVRLAGMIILNAAIFVVSKLVMGKLGGGLMNMMSGLSNMNGSQQAPDKAKKGKMKGPSININDLL